MTRIEEIDSQIEELKAEKKRLKEQSKYQLPTFEDFIKECNNLFYVPCTYEFGQIVIEEFTNKDPNALSIWIGGDSFKTEAECQKYIDKTILITRFKRFVEAFLCEVPIDWSNYKQCKYYLEYDIQDRTIEQNDTFFYVKQGVIYWTLENGFEIIKQNFTDTELKIILGVE